MTEKRQAVLIVSFGTSHEDTRKKTIDAITEAVRTSCPDRACYEAWTSNKIIEKMKKQGYFVMTVSQAMKQIREDGITDLVVLPTHILNGIENDSMKEEVMKWDGLFHSIRFGAPLISSTEDINAAVDCLMQEFGPLEEGTALIFMGHGTEHYVNTVYAALDYHFKDRGYEHVFMGTVEAYPSLDDVKRRLADKNYHKIILAPFMIVAGDHAKNDMAGEGDDSWKSQLEKEGYEVTCVLKGLGEYEGIRNLFLSHLRQA